MGLKWVGEWKKCEFLPQIHKFPLPGQGKIGINLGINPGINLGLIPPQNSIFLGLKSGLKWIWEEGKWAPIPEFFD